MTSVELRKLNAYPEWRSDNKINAVIQYVQAIQNNNPNPPINLQLYPTQRKRQRFIEKFEQGFRVLNIQQLPVLFYSPTEQPNQPSRINLRVLFPDQHQNILNANYNNENEGLGTGKNSFYNKVATRYLGITRAECREFLQKQGNYTTTRPIKKIVNKPILAKTSNERWQMDLCDLSNYGIRLLWGDNPVPILINGRYINATNMSRWMQLFNNNGRAKFILVVVDCFSKKLFGRALNDKNTNTVVQALQHICQNDAQNTFPHTLQTDNAPEFTAPQMQNFCQQHQILHILSSTYTPTSNGLVERAIQTLRSKIKAGFVQHNDLEWVAFLQAYLENINKQKQTTTNYTPNELWTPQYIPPPQQAINFQLQPSDTNTLNEIRLSVQGKLLKRASDMLRRTDRRGRDLLPTVFALNDLVRIKLATVQRDMRKRNKSKMQKKLTAITYSTRLFRVNTIIVPPVLNNFNAQQPVNPVWNVINQKYTVRDALTNEILRTPQNAIKEFFGSEMIKVGEPNIPSNVPTMARSKQINRFSEYQNP